MNITTKSLDRQWVLFDDECCQQSLAQTTGQQWRRQADNHLWLAGLFNPIVYEGWMLLLKPLAGNWLTWRWMLPSKPWGAMGKRLVRQAGNQLRLAGLLQPWVVEGRMSPPKSRAGNVMTWRWMLQPKTWADNDETMRLTGDENVAWWDIPLNWWWWLNVTIKALGMQWGRLLMNAATKPWKGILVAIRQKRGITFGIQDYFILLLGYRRLIVTAKAFCSKCGN